MAQREQVLIHLQALELPPETVGRFEGFPALEWVWDPRPEALERTHWAAMLLEERPGLDLLDWLERRGPLGCPVVVRGVGADRAPVLRQAGAVPLPSGFSGSLAVLEPLLEAQIRANRLERQLSALDPLSRASGGEPPVSQLEALYQQFEFALQAAGLGLWDWDIASGVQRWSALQKGLFGLEPQAPDSSIGAFLERVHPEDRARLARTSLEHAAAHGPDEFEQEFRILHPQGVRWLYGRGKVERDVQGHAVRMVGINFDISARKQLELERDQSMALLEGILHHAPLGIAVFDPQLRFQRINPWLARWGSLAPEQYRERSLHEGLPQLAALLEPPLRQALAQGEARLGLETAAPAAAGQDGVWLHHIYPLRAESGEVRGVTVLVEDISARKRQDAVLHQTLERFRRAQSAARGWVYEHDLTTGAVTRSDGVQSLLGYTPEELPPTAAAWGSIVHPEDRERAVEAVKRMFMEAGPYHFEYRVRHRDGHEVWVEERGELERDASGQVVRQVASTVDISARKAVELELEGAHAASRQFVSDLAHELRTPLTALSGNLELMLRYPEMTLEDRQEGLTEALGEARRLGRLATDLLALARGDAGVDLDRVDLPLRPVLLEVWREVQGLARGHTLELGTLHDLEISGHRDRLKQLLLILLDNALKYTPAPGKVTVSLERQGSEVALCVQDSGPGIAPEDLSRVFERFYRVRRAEGDPGGTGLGLPIARWIVQQHGGRIWLESEPGGGTTVCVRLPLLETDGSARREHTRGGVGVD